MIIIYMLLYVIIIIIAILLVIILLRKIYYITPKNTTKISNLPETPNLDYDKIDYGQSFFMKCNDYVNSFNGEVDDWMRSIAINCSEGTTYNAGLERGLAMPYETNIGKYNKLDIYYDKDNVDEITFYDTNNKKYKWGFHRENDILQPNTDCGKGYIIGLSGMKTINGIARLGVICKD